jgi:hypothetical protein
MLTGSLLCHVMASLRGVVSFMVVVEKAKARKVRLI